MQIIFHCLSGKNKKPYEQYIIENRRKKTTLARGLAKFATAATRAGHLQYSSSPQRHKCSDGRSKRKDAVNLCDAHGNEETEIVVMRKGRARFRLSVLCTARADPCYFWFFFRRSAPIFGSFFIVFYICEMVYF